MLTVAVSTVCDFNPLPPCGGRPPARTIFFLVSKFQSTPSVWRETVYLVRASSSGLFQSTPSVWRETCYVNRDCNHSHISIHSLRVEEDSLQFCPLCLYSISIHSLRVEGDHSGRSQRYFRAYFNPLPPCGGRRLYAFSYASGIVFQSTPSVWRETSKRPATGHN